MRSSSFDALSPQADDPLLTLIGEVRSDPRPEKTDLGVGIYRNEQGQTPIFQAVKTAERTLLETQNTKAYLGLSGNVDFTEAMWQLVGGASVTSDRVIGLQTVGGSGALRLAADLLREVGCKHILVGAPTWPNHAGIFGAARLAVREYPFFDIQAQATKFDTMMEALASAEPGSAALLHACCHNPTGASLSLEMWREIADTLARRCIVPLVDLAYLGLGRGIDEDVAGLRLLLETVPEALVAVSASKSFGLYRERTGAIFAVASSPRAAEAARSHLQGLARTDYSMPPDHGAAVVRTILRDAELGSTWRAELETMRTRIMRLRRLVAEACDPALPALRHLAHQEGMFSMLPLTPETVQHLKRERAIYMPSSGRINVAGLREDKVSHVMREITLPLLHTMASRTASTGASSSACSQARILPFNI